MRRKVELYEDDFIDEQVKKVYEICKTNPCKCCSTAHNSGENICAGDLIQELWRKWKNAQFDSVAPGEAYISRDGLIAWLKTIPIRDLSDGLGLCCVIMESDFKRAIKNMPCSLIKKGWMK